MVDKQFASVNNVRPEPWTGQDTRDRGMRCLIAPHFLALSKPDLKIWMVIGDKEPRQEFSTQR